MMKNWLASLALPALTLLLQACGSTPEPVVATQVVGCSQPKGPLAAPEGPALVSQNYGPNMTPVPLNSVMFSHQQLAERVVVQGLFTERAEGGGVRVTARFVNCTDAPEMLRARISFLTKTTAPAEAPSGWKPVPLGPRGLGLYSEVSISTDSVNSYVIELAPMQ